MEIYRKKISPYLKKLSPIPVKRFPQRGSDLCKSAHHSLFHKFMTQRNRTTLKSYLKQATSYPGAIRRFDRFRKQYPWRRPAGGCRKYCSKNLLLIYSGNTKGWGVDRFSGALRLKRWFGRTGSSRTSRRGWAARWTGIQGIQGPAGEDGSDIDFATLTEKTDVSPNDFVLIWDSVSQTVKKALIYSVQQIFEANSKKPRMTYIPIIPTFRQKLSGQIWLEVQIPLLRRLVLSFRPVSPSYWNTQE